MVGAEPLVAGGKEPLAYCLRCVDVKLIQANDATPRQALELLPFIFFEYGARTMRLILMDNNSGYICGDTAVYLAGSPEWRDNAESRREAETLSLLASRLLDEGNGVHGRSYEFMGANPHVTSSGYHIYRADVSGVDVIPIVRNGRDGAIINAVAANCHYIGFVRYA
ncbi:hypothetical protein WOC76_21465 [Methylocystis sp. IM3]|jgi:hypothetical protein|uniref:hypothetical protein n=1 Tax=unclassified Methylocystis TaxID=2625913 RepID=UPI0030F91745